MKATNVSRLRTAEASRVFDELRQGSDEPIAVLSNAEIIGYLVSSRLWDETQPELKRLRRRNRERGLLTGLPGPGHPEPAQDAIRLPG